MEYQLLVEFVEHSFQNTRTPKHHFDYRMICFLYILKTVVLYFIELALSPTDCVLPKKSFACLSRVLLMDMLSNLSPLL